MDIVRLIRMEVIAVGQSRAKIDTLSLLDVSTAACSPP